LVISFGVKSGVGGWTLVKGKLGTGVGSPNNLGLGAPNFNLTGREETVVVITLGETTLFRGGDSLIGETLSKILILEKQLNIIYK
jgi:hypothetical protein